jgi:hypothetical protein
MAERARRAAQPMAGIQPVSNRRVADLSAAELLDEALRRFEDAGWTSGRWRIELLAEEGRVQRLEPVAWDTPPLRLKVGRRALAQR